MYSDIMNRPMFQTPQQRQGMGIMAGVAPVRGYEEGGMAVPEYTPKFMREEQTEEDGIGRMLFEILVVDPDDPIDVGIATASAAMMAGGITAPGAIAAQLTRMGYKGKKLFDAVKKVESLGKPSKASAGIVRQAMAPVGATYGASQTGRMIGEAPEMVEAVGGIAQLAGGGFLEGLIQSIPGRGGKVIELLNRGIDAGRVAIDDILNALKRGDIEQREADALVAKMDEVYPGDVPVNPQMRASDLEVPQTTPKMKADDLATPPESAIPTPPKPPATGKAVDDATEAAEEAAKKAAKKPITQRVRQSVPGQVVSGALKPITSPIRVGAPVAAGAYALNQLIESGKIQEAIDMAMNDPTVKSLIDAGKPAYEAVTEFFGPIGDALFPDTGERVELTESAQARLPEVEKARKEGFPELPTDAKKDDGTGTSAPEATGIMKFLFGKDGIGGDPGAVGKIGEKLRDPRTQYALAKAAAPSEGRTPRNLLSDLALAGVEYDQLQGKDETALMQNYEFLKQAGKSDDEIFDLLLSKDTASDQTERYQDQVLSLFNAAQKNPENTGKSNAELLQEARLNASIILNQPVGASDTTAQRVTLEPQ